MKSKIYCIGVVAFGLLILAGCAGLIPPEAAAGMNGTPTRVKSTSDYPEHFVYRIDEHRYITIRGNNNCEGTIYYYDTRLKIRTAVAATGLTLGDGAFSGYYAIDSNYIAIPSIKFSQTNGILLYVYYSSDDGRTFKNFLAGGYGLGQDVFILKDKTLYIARKSHNPLQGIYEAYSFSVDSDVVDDSHRSGSLSRQQLDVMRVPINTKSPSLSTSWSCEQIR
jgi:hypothetical protein